MKRVLFTGGTGFLGRNLIPKLRDRGFEVYAPQRSLLDLRNTQDVEAYVKQNEISIVIHSAIPNILPGSADKRENLFYDSMLTFMNLYRLQRYYEKMIYFGSGAEFDKHFPIISVKEEEFGNRVPTDDYGLAKYTMNELCLRSDNVYNLRIFGCFGPTDASTKLLTSAIRYCLKNQDIRLHQDCYFDYIHVDDIVPILSYFIRQEPKFHDYNMCSGQRYRISDICKIVKEETRANIKICTEISGLNNEYTGSNTRLVTEVGEWMLIGIREGIKRQIAREKEVIENEKESC